VNITIIDQYGRVISDNGTNQIPNATVASTDETKFFYLPLDLTYNVSISAYNTGNFTLTIITPIANNTVAGIIYENIPVTYTTKATLEIVPNQIAQIMKIDNDGDDVIDEEKNPDVSETISISPPPLSASISPLSASITVGESLTFTSTVSGGYTPYSYQWYLNGAPVSGTTSASWTFTPTTSGIYYIYLKVTDDIGNTTQSETARITVTTVPVGGYSVPIQLPATAQPATIHIALLTILTAIFITIKRKTKRKH